MHACSDACWLSSIGKQVSIRAPQPLGLSSLGCRCDKKSRRPWRYACDDGALAASRLAIDAVARTNATNAWWIAWPSIACLAVAWPADARIFWPQCCGPCCSGLETQRACSVPPLLWLVGLAPTLPPRWRGQCCFPGRPWHGRIRYSRMAPCTPKKTRRCLGTRGTDNPARYCARTSRCYMFGMYPYNTKNVRGDAAPPRNIRIVDVRVL